MNLRVFFFLCFSGIAFLSVLVLASWIFADALDRQITGVKDKNLVIARNVGAALERYTLDLKNAFELMAGSNLTGTAPGDVRQFLTSLNFVHFCFADIETGRIIASLETDRFECPSIISEKRFNRFKALLKPGETVFSPVMKDPRDRPVFYLLRAHDDVLTVAAVLTTYVVEQGKAVSFGVLGHAAIVDSAGQVIAHPLDDWQQQIKDLSAVDPVKRMLAGETGTSQFFSPALNADMVTGFTGVSTPGWGVMVPQPVSEIRQEAEVIQRSAALVGVVGLLAAGLLGWFLSGYLSRSLQSVADASSEMAAGNLDARVVIERGWKPSELLEVSRSFNSMADEVSRVNTELLGALAEADQANRAKSEFLAVTSHEFRTPLNAILGFSEVMKDKLYGDIDEKYYECAKDIYLAGEHLYSLINDVLLISKMGSVRELEEDTISVCEILRAMHRSNRVLAETKHIDFSDSCPDPDLLLRVDERLFRQVLINLIGNAVKFTPENGKVTLSATAGPEGVEVSVSDTGIGISEEEVDEIWTAFHQVENSLARKHEGSGLGLTIVAAIVGAHDGHVSLRSAPGEGSTFTVRLPVSRLVNPITNG